MSKIDIHLANEFLDKIENKIIELNKHFVLVNKEDISLLNEANIGYFTFASKDYFIVKRGRKSKRFNKEQQKEILNKLQQGLSIRKCSVIYKCSTRTIQEIKKGIY